MNSTELKMAAVIAWAVIWSVIALQLVSSVGTWILVVGLGVLAPLAMMRMWRPVASTVPAIVCEAHK